MITTTTIRQRSNNIVEQIQAVVLALSFPSRFLWLRITFRTREQTSKRQLFVAKRSQWRKTKNKNKTKKPTFKSLFSEPSFQQFDQNSLPRYSLCFSLTLVLWNRNITTQLRENLMVGKPGFEELNN